MHYRTSALTITGLFVALALYIAACAPAPTPVPSTAAPTSVPATATAVPVPATSVSATSAPTSATVATLAPAAATAAPPTQAAATSAPAATTAPLIKLRVPYTAISVAMAPTWVAQEKGLFKKHGLDVTMDYIATSPVLTAAMLAGEVQIAEAAEDVVITSGLGGSDIVIIASGGDHLLFSLYTKPEINSLADLKGKTIAVTRRGSSTDFAAHWLLTKNNIVPDKEVAFINAGGVPDILTAMQTGQVAAGVLSPPTTTKARQAGFKELVDISAQDLTFYQAPVIARKSWIAANPDIVRKFMSAYVEAISVIKKDKASTKTIIGKYTQTTDDAILEESYNAFIKILPNAPYPKLEAIQVGLDQAALDNPKAKEANPNNFFDPTWVGELDKNGFIAGLYK